MPTMIVIGDTCPIGRNQPLFLGSDVNALLNDLMPVFEGADLVFANLECPLVDTPTPVVKTGPVLEVPVECVSGVKKMGIDVVGLANNHIMDHGEPGLRTTISTLLRNGLRVVGAGENLDHASKILIVDVQGVRVGILAMVEHGFGSATRKTSGVNPLDPIQVVRELEKDRDRYDHLVAIVHGGNEYYYYPRPGLSSFCRFLVERGCEAVICQHSHCVGSMEVYRGKPIIYGQGNFLFDYPTTFDRWNEGMIVELTFSGKDDLTFRLIPFVQMEGATGIRSMTSEENDMFFRDFNERSRRVTDLDFIEREWAGYCRKNKRFFLHRLHGKPGLWRRLFAKVGLLHLLDPLKVQVNRKNLVECESYLEALVTILDVDIHNREK